MEILSLEEYGSGAALLIDKPLTWTSFDVVKKLRYLLKVKKIGHAGTLDPLATGLLILCTGKMTKQINTYQEAEKEYEGTFTLGKTTPSYDLETEFDTEQDYSLVTSEMIDAVVATMTGHLQQMPPIYSAIKKDGVPAYKRARQNQEVKLDPRPVEIKEFEITRVALPEVDFRIVCSKGTYIRSMAHDFGAELEVGAHLSRLVRTRIGDFKLSEAWKLENFVDQINVSL
jgi:tRNA pseudouridine55 synthase